MDELFREINTQLGLKYFDKLYVSIHANERVRDELLRRVSNFRRKLKRRRGRQEIGTEQIFIITGRTGCGKSAFINNLRLKHQLSTRLPGKGQEGVFVLYIDCLRIGRFEEVIRKMLIALAEECRRSKSVWTSLKSKNWAERLQTSRISTMPSYTLLSVLRGVMRHLHLKQSKHLPVAVPVVFVLDNMSIEC